MDVMQAYIDRSNPEDRAGLALLIAGRLVDVAAYYAVQVDPDAPRLLLFDLSAALDAATEKISGQTG
ncbi:MAG: hypothetical protein AAGF30_16340 [Pseudomonadota bacterium]